MEDPGKKRRKPIIDVILILLAIVLIYVLYTLVGGNWTPSDLSGGSNPFGKIAEDLSAIGRGIGKMFGNMVP